MKLISYCAVVFFMSFLWSPLISHAAENVNGLATPKFWKVAIIGEESRRRITRDEFKVFGHSIGTVECQSPETKKWFVSTGYVVASNLIKISAKSLYENIKQNEKIILRRVFDPLRHCSFILRDYDNDVIGKFDFDHVQECPGHQLNANYSNCDWAVVRIKGSLPRQIQPLPLQALDPKRIIGVAVIAVGHHSGVYLDGKPVSEEEILVDFGKIREKPANSRLAPYPKLFLYDADTSQMASGQPILTRINGRLMVIGPHVGEWTLRPRNRGEWDPNSLFELHK